MQELFIDFDSNIFLKNKYKKELEKFTKYIIPNPILSSYHRLKYNNNYYVLGDKDLFVNKCIKIDKLMKKWKQGFLKL